MAIHPGASMKQQIDKGVCKPWSLPRVKCLSAAHALHSLQTDTDMQRGQEAHIIDAVQEAARHIHRKHEDDGEAEDNDGVQVGCGKSRFEASNSSVHHHSDLDKKAHRCMVQ